MRIQRLQTRIIVFFVALLALVQVAAFWFVNAANSRNAQTKVAEELNVGQRVFARLLDQNSEKLKLSARVLAGDFAFREAIATHDTGTIASVLANHGARIGATAMVFVDLKGVVVADTLQQPRGPTRSFEYPELLGKDAPGASLEVLDGHAFQLVAVPILAPLPIGWVVMGFAVDDALARDLRQLTELEVSFTLEGAPAARRMLASTLDEHAQQALLSHMPVRSDAASHLVMNIAGIDHQALVIPLNADKQDGRIVAVLHRSLEDALAAFERLRNTLIVLAGLSLVLSIIGSVAVARNITRPLETLASAAARIEKGDYDAPVDVRRSDEIGVLASSLNHMRGSIADREKRILKLAYEDPLTDLANRSRFSNELERAITQSRDGRGKLTILMMDLDRFKYVNDTLGHDVGDHVLREVSTRLQDTVKNAECIARLGGDEFAILVRHEGNPDLAATARQIIAALEAPILFEGQPLDVGTSIGIAHFPEHGQDVQTLVRNADIAMYAAKRNKTGFATYEQHYDTSQQEHLSLLGELRRAVEHNELRLHYQPKVSLHSSRERSRSADPLGASGARPRVAGAVHPLRRTHRLHQTTDALGTPRGGPPVWPVAARGLDAAGIREHLRARSHEPRAAGSRGRAAGRIRRHPGPAVPGDHRERIHGGSGARAEGARSTCRARRETVDRRLRHWLLLALLHHEIAGAGAEDRSVVHLADGDRRRDLDDRAFDHRPRAQPRVAGRRRGR